MSDENEDFKYSNREANRPARIGEPAGSIKSRDWTTGLAEAFNNSTTPNAEKLSPSGYPESLSTEIANKVTEIEKVANPDSDCLTEEEVETIINEAPADDEWPLLTLVKGEYFQLYNSKDEQFFTLRALKDFEILARGKDPEDLANSLENDGFAEILPSSDVMDGIDFAWDY
jgi:hypothetical protein